MSTGKFSDESSKSYAENKIGYCLSERGYSACFVLPKTDFLEIMPFLALGVSKCGQQYLYLTPYLAIHI